MVLEDIGPGQSPAFRRPHAREGGEIDHRAIAYPAFLHEVIFLSHEIGGAEDVADFAVGRNLNFRVVISYRPPLLMLMPAAGSSFDVTLPLPISTWL